MKFRGPHRTPGRPLAATLRIVLMFASIVVLLGAFASISALHTLDDDTTEVLDSISPARLQAANLTTAYLDQESGVRGYVLSRDMNFLTPYMTGQTDAAAADTAIRTYLPLPAVTTSLDRIDEAGTAWRREFADHAVAAAKAAGQHGKVKLNEKLGKARFDAIRTQIDGLTTAIAAERAKARAHVDDGLVRLRFLVAFAFGAVLVVGVLIWLALRRLILRPLDRLAAETRTVAGGDFAHVVQAAGPAEIRALGADVETMRERISLALTMSRSAEGEIREQARLLEQQAAELEAQAIDLRRSNDELEQFAYVASHDLQEPLRKVASFCQMLQRRYGGQLDERADQYIGFAVDGAKRMQQLINDLLAFSRVGRTTERMEEIDTRVIAGHAVDALGEVVAETGATVEIGDLPTVHGDDALLTQVFQNLIGNAIKFHAPDRPPVVKVTAEREDEFWHFRCEDNGIGIDPQYADRIFVIFQRLHSKDQYTGTGIGLSLCRKIVEYHGGRIWLDTEREVQVGTVVHWTLPVEPLGSPVAAQPGPPAERDADPGSADANDADIDATAPLRKVSS